MTGFEQMDAVSAAENLVEHFLGEAKKRSFEDKLFLNNSRFKGLRGFIFWSIIEGMLLMPCIGIALQLFAGLSVEKILFILIGGFFLPFGANYIYQDIVFEKRKRNKEELLSDLLLEASIFCDEASMEKTIRKIGEADFPLLSKDFERAYLEIRNGAGVEEALVRIKQLNHSRTYSRAIDLFIEGYKSGAHISDTLKEAAEDLLESKAIIKERQAVMLVTKYTLLLSAGLIVPAIMGLIIGLVGGLNFEGIGELGIGIAASQRKELFASAVFASTAYVFEYAALSSFFLAQQEANKKNFWIYALILLPLAGAVFFSAKTMH